MAGSGVGGRGAGSLGGWVRRRGRVGGISSIGASSSASGRVIGPHLAPYEDGTRCRLAGQLDGHSHTSGFGGTLSCASLKEHRIVPS